nr:endonuclease/exonuclease/phosphatase family protein [Polymorphobacter multimanifer]
MLVASYNIHKAVGTDGRRMPERILDVLAEIGADVAVLQEADTRFGVRTSVFPGDMLGRAGWQAAPVAEHAAAIGWHGNAILVREGVELVRAARLPLPALEPRGAVMADVATGGLTLRLVGAHLDLSGLWRARQVRELLAGVARAPGNPPELVMGDFNEWRPMGAAMAAFGERLRVVPLPPSFPARMPLGRLDRAFANPALKVLDSGVHRSALSRLASDHLPVWVQVAHG